MEKSKNAKSIVSLLIVGLWLAGCSTLNVQDTQKISNPSMPVEKQEGSRILSRADLDYVIDAKLSRKDAAAFLKNIKIENYEVSDPNTNWTDAKIGGAESKFSIYYLTYRKTHFILLLNDAEDRVSSCIDILVLPRLSPNYELGMGQVEIDRDHTDENVVVIYNNKWTGNYSDDIVAAYRPNIDTRQLETVKYESIRIYRDQ